MCRGGEGRGGVAARGFNVSLLPPTPFPLPPCPLVRMGSAHKSAMSELSVRRSCFAKPRSSGDTSCAVSAIGSLAVVIVGAVGLSPTDGLRCVSMDVQVSLCLCACTLGVGSYASLNGECAYRSLAVSAVCFASRMHS
jgi:hypothetical protein